MRVKMRSAIFLTFATIGLLSGCFSNNGTSTKTTATRTTSTSTSTTTSTGTSTTTEYTINKIFVEASGSKKFAKVFFDQSKSNNQIINSCRAPGSCLCRFEWPQTSTATGLSVVLTRDRKSVV